MREEHDQIPSSWVITTLGEVTDPNRARHRPQDYSHLPFVGMEHIEAHTMKLLGTVSAAEMRSSAVHFWPGDVLYGRLRPYLRKVFLPNFEGLCSAEFIVFPAQDRLSAKYLQYFLTSPHFTAFAHHLSEGDRPRIDFHQISRCPFPLPPLPEQVRICEEIDKQFTRLDAAIESLRQIQTGLKKYRASVLKAACEGRLVPTEAELARAEGRGYEAAENLLRTQAEKLASKAQKRRINVQRTEALPEGWTWATMPQLGELSRGKSKHRPRNDPRLFGGPYPFIQTGEVRSSRGWIRSFSSTYNEVGLAQSRLWPSGTLCITIAANIAETGILTFPACFPDSVVGFQFDGDPVVVRYVELFLRTAKSDLERLAPATAQKNINLDTLSVLAIATPPLAEMRRIVAEVDRRFSIADEVESAIKANVERATGLRLAILRRAFQGRLVDQDPSDESAAALLERIHDARSPASRTERMQSTPSPAAAPESDPGKPPFVEHDPAEQMELAWEILFGRGLFEKEDAVRTIAEGIRDQGLAHFQRLRKDGPLFNDIASTIDRGVRQGFFDRPKRGHVRAILPDPKAYSPGDWRLCLLGALDGKPVEEEDALPAAAKWARETLGLEFARLRGDGVILRGLRAALKEALGRGEVERVGRGQIRRAG